jgi:hypothetical protein
MIYLKTIKSRQDRVVMLIGSFDILIVLQSFDKNLFKLQNELDNLIFKY